MAIAIQALAHLLVHRADRRVAAVPLRVATTAQPSRFVRLTQAELGEMANGSRDVVNPTLAQLEAKGCVTVGYHRLQVTDPTALARCAHQAAERGPPRRQYTLGTYSSSGRTLRS